MKKFLFFSLVIILLIGAVAYTGYRYLIPKEFVVFVETFDNGVITVDSLDAVGDDSKYHFKCKSGETVTFNINPVRNNKKYYNLKKLTANGVDVTDEVNMLQYRTKVTSKLDIVASFEKGELPDSENITSDKNLIDKPVIKELNSTPYLGSLDAYNIKDPSIIYDSKSGHYYAFGSDNVVVRSDDLINWTDRTNYFENAFSSDEEEIFDFSMFSSVEKWAKTHGYDKDESHTSPTNNRSVLAPDIIRIDDTYYLYFSISKIENANESAIFCVSTDDLENAVKNKEWDECGLVISSCGTTSKSKEHYDASNANHPSVFVDENNNLFMAYGSYFGKDNINGGIYLLELDKKTGLLKKDSKINSEGEKISTLHGDNDFSTGKLIARPGSIPSLSKNQGSLVSASDVVYNKTTGYYYLFMTYGVEEKNYNIRVARSKSVDGPYVDYNDESVAKFENSKKNNQFTKGLTVIGGYNFNMSSNGSVAYTDVGRAAPGCPSIIKASNGKWIMALQSQIYFKADNVLSSGEMAAKAAGLNIDSLPSLEIRQLFWTSDGWPIALPESYADESTKKSVSSKDMQGNWDVIVFEDGANQTNYKATACSHSTQVSIFEGYAISSGNIQKNTKLDKLDFSRNYDNTYNINVDGVKYTVQPVIVWDWELSTGAVSFVGIGEDGSTIWGKKNYSPYMGIFTDTFYYLLENVDDVTRDKYEKKIAKLDNPSQSEIDSMVKAMIKTGFSE